MKPSKRPLTKATASTRVENLYLACELKKSQVTKLAERCQADGVISAAELEDIYRISKDRDQCAEDVLDELRGDFY